MTYDRRQSDDPIAILVREITSKAAKAAAEWALAEERKNEQERKAA